MKKVIGVCIIVCALLSTMTVEAQSLKELLAAKKIEAKEKANAKLSEKSTEGIDAAMNAPEKIVKKKIEKKKEKKQKNKNQSTEEKTLEPVLADAGISSSAKQNLQNITSFDFIVMTNIKCAVGKKNIESLLSSSTGVNSVIVDENTGKVFISADGNKTVLSAAIKTILANGFDADGKKATSTKNNPCK